MTYKLLVLMIGVIALLAIHHVNKKINVVVHSGAQYEIKLNEKTAKIDELLTNIDVLKKVVGWKTEEIPDTYCIGSQKFLVDGAFSVVTRTPNKCYGHEFTRLNSLVKVLDIDVLDGKFDATIRQLKNSAGTLTEKDLSEAKKLMNRIVK